ncbi:MAG: S-methyl-5'-thioadenosine phosphorylase [Bdellovibrio sp.]
MADKIGIIGGSGVYSLDKIKVLDEIYVDTPFGKPSDAIIKAMVEDTECYFLARHARGHKVLPHEVNYRANIYALKKLGVRYLISVSAVGSLKEEHAPTKFVLPDQFIDWTKGKRERTFLGNGIVGHVSVAHPVSKELQEIIAYNCEQLKLNYSKGGSYICIEGPQFSTKAESNIYRGFGADIIGMTNVPEAFLAKEAAMAYATIAMVTDYDCWKEEHCTVEEIMKVMVQNNQNVQKLLLNLIPSLNKSKFQVDKENISAIMTPKDALSSFNREIVEVLQQ